MRTTKVLLLVSLSMCCALQPAEAQTGTLEGAVLVDGAVPLPNVIVDVNAYPPYYFDSGLTDSNGHYEIASVPTGVEVRVFLAYMNLGYEVVSPTGGEARLTAC